MGELTPIALSESTNAGRDGLAGATKLVNCYKETVGPDGKFQFNVVAINGYEAYATLTGATGGVRGMLDLGEELLVVAGNQVYTVNEAQEVTLIGGLPGTGLISMARNRQTPNPQAAIVSSDGNWFIYQNGTLTERPDPDLVNPIFVTQKDGYFVFLLKDGRFFISGIDNASIDALDFASAQSSADEGVALATRGTELLIMGEDSIEFWVNTGNADFPFELQAYRGYGCYAAGSVAEISALIEGRVVDSVIWAATDEKGKFLGIYMLTGYEAQKISTYEIDRKIEASASPADIRAFAWSENGHVFYTIKGPSYSYTYDTLESAWHERASQGYDYWRVTAHQTFQGLTIFGDSVGGALYKSDVALYSALSAPIQMQIQVPITHAWPYELVLNRVVVDAVTGVGANTTDDDIANPEVIFSMSLDGGRNWSAELHRSLGAEGQTQTQMDWWGLGLIRRTGTILRFQVSPGVKRIMMGLAVDVERLAA